MSTIARSTQAGGGWLRIELGAGNYGDSTLSCGWKAKTGGVNPRQYEVLFKSVDGWIRSSGAVGTLVLNDYQEGPCALAVSRVQDYIARQYPNARITVRSLVCNYFDIERALNSDPGLKGREISEIALRNPEKDFFYGEKITNNQSPSWLYRMTQITRDFFLVVPQDNRMDQLRLLDVQKMLDVTYETVSAADPYVGLDGIPFDYPGLLLKIRPKA